MHVHHDQKHSHKPVSADVAQKQEAAKTTLQLADERPENKTFAKLQAIVHQSSMVQQLKSFQNLANNSAQESAIHKKLTQSSGVIQGYFTFDKQKTNSDKFLPEYEEDTEAEVITAGNRKYLWDYFLLPRLQAKEISAELIQEFKERLLDMALDGKNYSFDTVADQIVDTGKVRARTVAPLSDKASPGTLAPIATNPEIEGKDKHGLAKYKVKDTEDEYATFSSDSYTKGPARRRDTGVFTTPLGDEAQTWTKVNVKSYINNWSCKVPLARHLADLIWPLIKNSKEGRNWELKFREIDRLIDYRDSESQSKVLTIVRKLDNQNMVSISRTDYTFKARQALKKALIAGNKHPADQQLVTFYDKLLKDNVSAVYQAAGDSDNFQLHDDYEAAGSGLSMILTHWRPILFFDWILAEDVMNHAV